MLKGIKTLLEKLGVINQSIKPIKVLAGVSASLVAVTLGVDDLYQRYYDAGAASQITLTFSPPSPVVVGTKVQLGYRLPDHGYFSLWNIDAHSKIYRICPKPRQKIASIALNDINRIGIRKIQSDKAGAKEEILLLWTKNHRNHPPEIQYASEAAFRHYLTLHPNDWVEKKATLQIGE